jgi:hypothetical protein
MAFDWGLYSSFRRAPKLENRIQAQQQNVAYLTQINAMVTQKGKERLEAEALIQKTKVDMSEIDALAKDKTSLLQRVKTEERSILKGIAAAGGDARKYLNTGGMAALNNYQNNIKNSEELATTIKNKKMVLQYEQALAQGKVALPILKTDEEGKKQILSFQDQLDMYNKGLLEDIKWRGAQKPVKIDPLAVMRTKNPTGVGERPVRVDEYYGMLLAKGQDALLSLQMTKKADVQGSGNTALMWGPDKLYQQFQYSSALARQKSRGAAKLNYKQHKNSFASFVSGAPIWRTQTPITIDKRGQEGQVIGDFNELQTGETGTEIADYVANIGAGMTGKLAEAIGINPEDNMLTFKGNAQIYPYAAPEHAGAVTLGKEATTRSWEVANVTPVIHTENYLTKQSDGGYKVTPDRNNTMARLLVTLAPMTDEEADAEFIKMGIPGGDEEKRFYKSGAWYWDKPLPGYEEMATEQDDSDMVQLKFYMDIPVGYDTQLEFAKFFGQGETAQQIAPVYSGAEAHGNVGRGYEVRQQRLNQASAGTDTWNL